MKSSFVLASLLSISSIAPTFAFAEPGGVNINITCPKTTGDQNVLTNFGDYIAGYGQEVIENVGGMQIYFKSLSKPTNAPTKLTDYQSQAVGYESTSGQVNCSYASPNQSNPNFSVAYTLTNGKGGMVTRQSSNSITIKLPVGLRA